MDAVPAVRRADAVTAEIVRNGLIAVTEEMKTNLLRTAYNMIIYEAFDFTVGLFNLAGETVSIGLGLPMFIRGMSETVKAMIARYDGSAGIEPGDILLTNDAYITGSHLNHMTLVVPIFDGDLLIAYAASMAHWQDVGGTLGGISTDIFSEGLQMPIVKLYKSGVPDAELHEIISMNVRVPDSAMGDLRAQIAAIKTGERRFLELVEKYGREMVVDSIASMMDQSEAAARGQVLQIPDGVYEAESMMDDDGIVIGQEIPIRVRVLVQGDEMTVDLSGVASAVRGFFNSGITAGWSAAQVAFKCLTSPLELPINDGSFRPLRIILPPGKVISAEKPSPMRQWMTYPMTVVDTIFKALAPAIEDRVIAGHHADLLTAKISGLQPRTGGLFLYTGGLIGGGWGAKRAEDGVSATIAINDGDTHNGPTESLEAKFPLLVERNSLRTDSGGAGRQRGGLGVEHVVRALAPIGFNVQVERVNNPPWGLAGGNYAAGNEVATRRAGQPEQRYVNGKVFDVRLEAGDAYVLRSGGGGGYGNPRERAAGLVAEDVRQGYVSVEAARRDYGVVVNPVTLRIDAAGTTALRNSDDPAQ